MPGGAIFDWFPGGNKKVTTRDIGFLIGQSRAKHFHSSLFKNSCISLEKFQKKTGFHVFSSKEHTANNPNPKP